MTGLRPEAPGQVCAAADGRAPETAQCREVSRSEPEAPAGPGSPEPRGLAPGERPVPGAALGLVRMTEAKADGRRLSRYRLAGNGRPAGDELRQTGASGPADDDQPVREAPRPEPVRTSRW